MLFEWRTGKSSGQQDSFSFSTEFEPSTKLNFSSSIFTPTIRKTAKRSRPQADVDGECSGNLQKKKRRLRLNLITSRLSRPFATPTTHIVSRGTSKFAIWARHRILGRDLLRKAAIMNRIRITNTAKKGPAGGLERNTQPFARYEEAHEMEFQVINDRNSRQQPITPQKTSNQHVPQPRSPLGLSDDDEFGEGFCMFDDPDWEDMDGESVNSETVNSDFNRREPGAFALDDDDVLMAPEQTTNQSLPRIPSSAEIFELVAQEDRQKEMSLAQFGAWSGHE
ncbi:hypothetical protein MMC30_004545 [Trapelia coarctata]|nr:hypothetical protein [Trapelia coarctata]